MITWEDSRGGGTSDIYLQEINASGTIFEDGGISVCNADFDQRNPGVVLYSEADSSYILYWEDLRSSGKEFLWNIYAQSLTMSTMAVSGEQVPSSFSNSQNNPNPFNPITNINYSISTKAFVTMKVYNLLGQKITELVSRNTAPGQYSVNWDGTNQSGEQVPSGIYIYSIDTGEFQLSKKMVLMK